jgi:hypothetical protein
MSIDLQGGIVPESESFYGRPATLAEMTAAKRFAYQAGMDEELDSIAVLVDHGNYWFWAWFMTAENEDDAQHLVAALNSICVLFDGPAGFPK